MKAALAVVMFLMLGSVAMAKKTDTTRGPSQHLSQAERLRMQIVMFEHMKATGLFEKKGRDYCEWWIEHMDKMKRNASGNEEARRVEMPTMEQCD